MSILAIDPGISTGIAFCLWNAHNKEWIYATATCTSPQEVWEYIDKPFTTVVIEQFQAQLISKYGLDTVELVGGVEALCWKMGIEFLRQTPYQRKAYIALACSKVPIRGCLNATEQRHEIDAMSHLLRYQYYLGHITSLKP